MDAVWAVLEGAKGIRGSNVSFEVHEYESRIVWTYQTLLVLAAVSNTRGTHEIICARFGTLQRARDLLENGAIGKRSQLYVALKDATCTHAFTLLQNVHQTVPDPLVNNDQLSRGHRNNIEQEMVITDDVLLALIHQVEKALLKKASQ